MAQSDRHRSARPPAVGLALLDGGSILCAFLYAVYDWVPWDLTFMAGMLLHLPYFAIFVLFWFSAAIDQRLFGHWRADTSRPARC